MNNATNTVTPAPHDISPDKIPAVYTTRIIGIHRKELLPIAQKMKEGDPVILRFERYPVCGRTMVITASNEEGERFGFLKKEWTMVHKDKGNLFPSLFRAYVDQVKSYKGKPGLSQIYIRFAYADNAEAIAQLTIPYRKLFARFKLA